jgi:putative ABC transport system permease protein
MSHLLSDARYALRGMWKYKSTSALLVLTLAVGLAANAVIFNVLDVLVLRPFDFPNVPRVVRVWETAPNFDGINRKNVAPANLLDWQAQGEEAVRTWVGLEWWDANLRGEPLAERVQGYRVGTAFFETLGVRPGAGRGFLEEEGQAGRDRVVVLGHDVWQRSFGGDRGLVGRQVTVDGEAYTVVGIAPPGFRFPDGCEVWSPLVLPTPEVARRDQHYLSAFGLLAEGRTPKDAQAVLDVVARRLEKDHPDTNRARGLEVSAFSRGFGDPVLPSILVIWQAAAVLVLLIACVNVANLVLARGAERRRELALRLALGAGRGRIVGQLLTEGLVSSLAAVGLSIPMVALAMRSFRDHMPAETARFVPGWAGLGPDARTVFFSIGLAVLATALFSAVPALRASRPDLLDALRDGGRSVTAGVGRQRGRNALVVVQVAGALALVATAGFAVRSAHLLLNGPQGFDPDGLLTLGVSLSETRYADAARKAAFAREAEARLVALPGVSRVTVASTLPASNNWATRSIEIEGEPLREGVEPPRADAGFVSPGYFETLRVPIVAGRDFHGGDDESASPVAIVSRAMAERHWPGQDAVGRRFRVVGKNPEGREESWVTVVGVSGDVIAHWVMKRNAPTFYRPLRQVPRLELAFGLRVQGEPETLAEAARGIMTALDPDQPAHDVRSMRSLIRRSTIGLQYVAAIMAAFGMLALVLALSGVYGVMSYRVSLRTLEIGVRVALGASRGDVLRLTLGQAGGLAALGLVLGSVLAVAAGRALSAALHGAIAFDVGLLALLTGGLGAAALLAAFVPARRALGIDPARALRAE